MSAPSTRGATVFVCDDAPGIRRTLAQILADEGYRVEEFADGTSVLDRLLEPGPPAAALFLDVWLPDVDGLTVLDQIRARGLDLPVLMISGHGTVETAVQAVKKGADDFLEKPLALERVLLTLERALERSRLARERDVLAREVARQRERLEEEETLLGDGPAMSRLREEIRRAGASEARVLITGESGVGKEIVARTLHRASPRAARPFVEVNGAAIPEDLIESELFGHVKGSFTGATEDRKGKWELADGGTLFLDEIGDMSPRTQAKILRAIQDGKISRVGGARTIATDVRIVAATNRDLPKMIAAGTFREDLYFRLAVVPIRVPTLAERPEDVPALALHFARKLARRRGRRPATFTPEGARGAEEAPLARERPRAPERRGAGPPPHRRGRHRARGPPGGRPSPPPGGRRAGARPPPRPDARGRARRLRAPPRRPGPRRLQGERLPRRRAARPRPDDPPPPAEGVGDGR